MNSFEEFKTNFPNPIDPTQVLPEVIEKYKGVVPDSLVELWKQDGWAGYGYGMAWTINPTRYIEHLKKYVNIQYEAIPFLRSPFGDLVVMYYNSINNLVFDLINFRSQKIVHLSVTTINDLFNDYLVNYGLLNATDADEIFWEAYRTIGELKSDQCYGFHPILALGGEEKLENVKIVNFDNHLKILTEVIEKPIERN